MDEIVLSLTAKGLTTGEIAAHLDDVYGATVSKDTISRITDKVIEEMSRVAQPAAGCGVSSGVHRRHRRKIREGNVANRPIYVALGVTVDGTRDVLGLWAGERGNGEGSNFWLRS